MALLFVNVIVLVSLIRIDEVAGSKIVMSGPQVPSLVRAQSAVASELIARGHEVYMAIGSRIENPTKLGIIGIKILFYHIPDDVIYGLTKEFDKSISECVFNHGSVEYLASEMFTRDCHLMMQDESFKRKAKELRFDLAFIDPFIYAPCNLILGRYLEIPFVSMATMLLPWEWRIPALPSFYRILGWYPIADRTTFTGRMTNLFYFIVAESSVQVPGPHNISLLQQYAPELRSWKELIRKSELILTAIDHHMGVPLPTFPYFVTVPGISALSSRTLEPAMETLFRENSNGVVVMSLGSMVHYLPDETIKKFLEAFSRLKQTVIARMEPPTDGTIIPKNVKLFPWLPMNDLLGHANTRLFITHCGNSGQHEMLYHGVPFVGFPMFGDQDMNCQLAYERGYGIKMSILRFTSEELYITIEKVLSNENYTKAINKASQIFRDEPLMGRKKAAHWIEHVIKYGGSHLRSKSLDLPIYQFLMLDVIGVLVILGLAVVFLIKYMARLALRNFLDKRTEQTRSEAMGGSKYGSQKMKVG